MKSWIEFANEAPELARKGRELLFQSSSHIGLAFLATLRKDGAPRLHPVSLVMFRERLYVLIPPASPKCADLKRDGRYAMQAFPPAGKGGSEEFYLSGVAQCIPDLPIRQAMIDELGIRVEPDEILFEFYIDRAMHTMLVNRDTPDERPLHRKWSSGS